MMKPLAYAGAVALAVSCLTASSAHGQALEPADAPTTSPLTTAPDRSARPWLASPTSKPVATGETPEIPWKSAVLLVGVAVLAIFAWRSRNRFRGLAEGKAGARLSVVGSVRVGPKAHLVLAHVGDRSLLLGVTEDSVRRIAWIDQPAAGAAPPRLMTSSAPAKRTTSEMTAKAAPARDVPRPSPAKPAPSPVKTPIIDARPRNFLDAMRTANARAERSEAETKPSEQPPLSGDVAPSPYAEGGQAANALESTPPPRDSSPPRDSRPPPLESTPPPLESTPPPAESTPPPPRSLPNAALELAGRASDTVEWSRGATRAKPRRNTTPKVKAAPLAEAPRPAPMEEPVKSASYDDGGRAGSEGGFKATPIDIAKPLALAEVARPAQRSDVIDQDSIEGQAAGVLSRKVRRRV
jgi:flagellar biogenesis protein FliO